jgi:Zn-dependent peptidase ImmA (M78 family)
MPGKDTNIGAKRALQARERFGLDDVSPVLCVLTLVEEQARLPVAIGALPDDIAGALYRNGAGALVWVNGKQSLERQRFTIAHELGHVCCGHERPVVDTTARIFGGSGDPNEVQANAFAAQLLAPRDGVRAVLDGQPTLEDVVRIAARFGISTIAALYRLKTLNLVNERRGDQLQREIADGIHRDVWKYLDPPTLHDALCEIEPPRLPSSLADSALAGVLDGQVSVDAAAGATGSRADVLSAAAAAFSR